MRCLPGYLLGNAWETPRNAPSAVWPRVQQLPVQSCGFDPYDARLRQFPDYDVDAGNWVITMITASAEHRTWRRANDVTNDVTNLQQRHYSIRDCDVT